MNKWVIISTFAVFVSTAWSQEDRTDFPSLEHVTAIHSWYANNEDFSSCIENTNKVKTTVLMRYRAALKCATKAEKLKQEPGVIDEHLQSIILYYSLRDVVLEAIDVVQDNGLKINNDPVLGKVRVYEIDAAADKLVQIPVYRVRKGTTVRPKTPVGFIEGRLRRNSPLPRVKSLKFIPSEEAYREPNTPQDD